MIIVHVRLALIEIKEVTYGYIEPKNVLLNAIP